MIRDLRFVAVVSIGGIICVSGSAITISGFLSYKKISQSPIP